MVGVMVRVMGVMVEVGVTLLSLWCELTLRRVTLLSALPQSETLLALVDDVQLSRRSKVISKK